MTHPNSAAAAMALFRRTGDAAYDALRMKYDWSSPTPPPGYRYGVGRGAKPFITSAELAAVGTSGAFAHNKAAVQADSEFLNEMDRVAEAMQSHSRRKRQRDNDATTSAPSGGNKTKLTLEALMTVTNGLVEGAKPSVASSAQPQAASVKGNSSAGDLPMDSIQSHIFDTDIDIRRPMADFSQKALESSTSVTADMLTRGELDAVLKFGSEDDQKTWITRSRVQFQLGFKKKGMKELEHGCKQCGERGAAIWFERMSHLEDQPEAQRSVAEEAVRCFGGSEALWLKVVDLSPFHKQVEWLQTALIQLPTSEALWLRLLKEVPNPRDRKAIVRKCLETNESASPSTSARQNMSRLWGMLADLEPEAKGREILKTVAARKSPASISILVERAWFEEKHLAAALTGGDVSDGDSLDCIRPILELAASRERMTMLQRAVFVDAAATHLHGGTSRTDEATGAARKEWASVVVTSLVERRKPLTALLMGMCLVFPEAALTTSTRGKLDAALIPATWVGDLLGVLLQGSGIQDWTHAEPSTMPTGNETTSPDSTRLMLCLALVWAAQLLLWEWSGDASIADFSSWLHLVRSTIAAVKPEHLVAAPLAKPPVASNTAAVAEDEEEELLQPVGAPSLHATSAGGAVWRLLQTSLQVLSAPPKHSRVTDIVLVATKALFERGAVDAATACIQSSGDVFGDDRAVVALARLEQHKGRGADSDDAVEALLRHRCLQPSSGSYVWKKWLTHLRSCSKLTSAIAADAVAKFPVDVPLRLLQLRYECDRTQGSMPEAIRAPYLRGMYRAALREDEDVPCCRASPIVWAFAASYIESTVLVDPTAARRLIGEAMELFGPRRVVRNGIPTVTDMDEHMIAQLTPILEASVAIELRYADANAAIASIKPTLDKMASQKPDSLLALSIDLTPRATRGTAAGIAMRGNPNPGPLTRLAVARVYHAMKQYQKCVALVMAATLSQPRCGDAHGMLLALCTKAPHVYVELVVEELDKMPHHRGIASAFATYAKTVEEGGVVDFPAVVDAITHDAAKAKPNSGPLWLAVAKQADPTTNVVLSGLRQSTKVLLLAVAAKTEL